MTLKQDLKELKKEFKELGKKLLLNLSVKNKMIKSNTPAIDDEIIRIRRGIISDG